MVKDALLALVLLVTSTVSLPAVTLQPAKVVFSGSWEVSKLRVMVSFSAASTASLSFTLTVITFSVRLGVSPETLRVMGYFAGEAGFWFRVKDLSALLLKSMVLTLSVQLENSSPLM